jgi:hypothetical protein
MPSTAVPNILTDPGYLFWAPLLSAEPVNTVVGSKFTDAWPVAWISLGATEDGSAFTYETTVEPITVAEFFDPIRYSTTERAGNFAFNLADYTLNNLKRAFNGGTLATVSGAGATLLSSLVPPTPGNEVRAMIGWESLDNTMRTICYQTINSGSITNAYRKAPAFAVIPCTFNFEVPAAGNPWKMYSAGTARVGT